MFKIGDKIRVKPIEELEKLYKTDSYDLVKSMIKYGGKETRIKEVIDKENWNDENIPEYKLECDRGIWVWYSYLLES